ncbi:hypothetical protein C5167_017631 [Papaver somniferum]|uniref:Uncharacterized protein n=1 Tax=Papaver somniferum TaxID=3469 RepID=A0A4Y7IJY0_PAPSO|nr:hypothetical protein C5167_017631 [Papaver somniferum]
MSWTYLQAPTSYFTHRICFYLAVSGWLGSSGVMQETPQVAGLWTGGNEMLMVIELELVELNCW